MTAASTAQTILRANSIYRTPWQTFAWQQRRNSAEKPVLLNFNSSIHFSKNRSGDISMA
jgi:hypothetical protein